MGAWVHQFAYAAAFPGSLCLCLLGMGITDIGSDRWKGLKRYHQMSHPLKQFTSWSGSTTQSLSTMHKAPAILNHSMTERCLTSYSAGRGKILLKSAPGMCWDPSLHKHFLRWPGVTMKTANAGTDPPVWYRIIEICKASTGLCLKAE